MIGSFRSKKLKRLFEKGLPGAVGADISDRASLLLDQLDAAIKPEDMNIPGGGFHTLRGKPKRYSVHVNGNWRITFEWRDGDAIRVDLEDYH